MSERCCHTQPHQLCPFAVTVQSESVLATLFGLNGTKIIKERKKDDLKIRKMKVLNAYF